LNQMILTRENSEIATSCAHFRCWQKEKRESESCLSPNKSTTRAFTELCFVTLATSSSFAWMTTTSQGKDELYSLKTKSQRCGWWCLRKLGRNCLRATNEQTEEWQRDLWCLWLVLLTPLCIVDEAAGTESGNRWKNMTRKTTWWEPAFLHMESLTATNHPWDSSMVMHMQF